MSIKVFIVDDHALYRRGLQTVLATEDGIDVVGEAADGNEAVDLAEETLPRRFGRLMLLRRLARGGMGEVYLASTGGIEGAERPCVVKIIRRAA